FDARKDERDSGSSRHWNHPWKPAQEGLPDTSSPVDSGRHGVADGLRVPIDRLDARDQATVESGDLGDGHRDLLASRLGRTAELQNADHVAAAAGDGLDLDVQVV